MQDRAKDTGRGANLARENEDAGEIPFAGAYVFNPANTGVIRCPGCQKDGGVQALITTQGARPTLRKRCGSVLSNR